MESAVSLGFNNVIDAFPIVNNGPVPQRFFMDERMTRKGITLTDTLLNLATTFQAANLPSEVEARWRLVETAFRLGHSQQPFGFLVQQLRRRSDRAQKEL